MRHPSAFACRGRAQPSGKCRGTRRHGNNNRCEQFAAEAANEHHSGNRRDVGLLARLLTFHYVAFAWIFFRAADLDTALSMLGRIASLSVSFVNVSVGIGVTLAVGWVAHYLPKRWYESGLNLYVRAPFYAQAVALAVLVFSLRYVVTTGAAPFIYNQF